METGLPRYKERQAIRRGSKSKKKIEVDMPESRRGPVREYLNLQGISFSIETNESIATREIEAMNWLDIVRTLYRARYLESVHIEEDIVWSLHSRPGCTGEMGEWIDPGDREGTFLMELALYRLLHRGKLSADFSAEYFSPHTEVTLC
jgi:hypothetical protein